MSTTTKRGRSHSRSRTRSHSRSRSRNRSTNQTSDLKLNDFLSNNGLPLPLHILWAARINQWVNSGLLNVTEDNHNLIKIKDVNSFNNHRDTLLKTNTIMIVQNDNIIGFGEKPYYNKNADRLFFGTYIRKDELNNYENYKHDAGDLKINDSYKFYILKTPSRGGAVMRKSKKSRKSRKSRKM
jgi:hypothetical protein